MSLFEISAIDQISVANQFTYKFYVTSTNQPIKLQCLNPLYMSLTPLALVVYLQIYLKIRSNVIVQTLFALLQIYKLNTVFAWKYLFEKLSCKVI